MNLEVDEGHIIREFGQDIEKRRYTHWDEIRWEGMFLRELLQVGTLFNEEGKGNIFGSDFRTVLYVDLFDLFNRNAQILLGLQTYCIGKACNVHEQLSWS